MDIPVELQNESLSPQPSGGLPMDATPQAFGAGVGQSLEVGAEVATKLSRDQQEAMKQEQNQRNRVGVQAAHNQLNDFTIERLYHPKSGALMQQQGNDAPAVTDKTLTDYDKAASAISARLPNEEQRQAFQNIVADHRSQVTRELYAHEAREVNRYADEQSTQGVQNAQTLAIQAAVAGDQPGETWQQSVANQVATGTKTLWEANARNGVPADTGVAAFTSQTHMLVLKSLLDNGQDQTAKAWYDTTKGSFTAHDAVEAAARVKTGSSVGDALRIGDQLAKPDDAGVMPSRESMMAQIAKMDISPQVREMAENRVNTLANRHEADVKDHQEASANTAKQLLQDPANTLGINDPRVQQARLSMTADQWSQVERVAAAQAKDESVTTNLTVYDRLHRAATGSPDERAAFLKEDIPTTYGGLLDAGAQKEVIGLQDSLRREITNGTPDAKLASATLIRQIGTDTLVGHGRRGTIDEKNVGSPDAPDPANLFAVQYHAALRKQVAQWSALHPEKKPDADVIQKLADGLLIRHATGEQRTGFWGEGIFDLWRTGETPGLGKDDPYPFQSAADVTP